MMVDWSRELASALKLFTVVIVIAIAPAQASPTDDSFPNQVAVLVAQIYQLAGSVIQSQYPVAKLETQKASQNLVMQAQQITQLADLLATSRKVRGELRQLQGRVVEFETHLTKEIEYMFDNSVDRDYLTRIDSLLAEVQMMAKEGIDLPESGNKRLEALDTARHRLMAAQSFQTLPVVMSLWAHDIAYRRLLGHDSDEMREIDQAYRNNIRYASQTLSSSAEDWQHQVERLKTEISKAMVHHSRRHHELIPFYGTLSGNSGAIRDVTVCECVNRGECQFPDLGLHIVDGLHMDGSRPHDQCIFEDDSVWFTHIKFQYRQAPTHMGVDDKLTDWLQFAANERLDIKIDAYWTAVMMSHIVREFANAAELVWSDIADMDFSSHIDVIGESKWTQHFADMNEIGGVLSDKNLKRVIEVGIDVVLTRKYAYPQASELLEHAGFSVSEYGIWEMLSRISLPELTFQTSESAKICDDRSIVECLDDMLRQAEGWRDKRIKAHTWDVYTASCQECRLIGEGSIVDLSSSSTHTPQNSNLSSEPEFVCLQISLPLGMLRCADENSVEVLSESIGSYFSRMAGH